MYLNHAVRVHDIEYLVRVRQLLAIRDAQLLGGNAVQREVFACKIDCGLRQVHAGDARASACKPDQIGTDAAPDFEQPPAAKR